MLLVRPSVVAAKHDLMLWLAGRLAARWLQLNS